MTAEEINHEILCAVIQEEWPGRQALSDATLHNAPLRTIDHGRAHVAVSKKLLKYADIVTGFQEMRRK